MTGCLFDTPEFESINMADIMRTCYRNYSKGKGW